MDGLLSGVLLGLSIAAPIGPVGAFCIQRSMAGGFPSGFAAGLGAATVHATYSGLVVLGFTAAGALTGDGLVTLRLAGALLLLWLGWRALSRGLSPPPEGEASPAPLGCYAASVLLTLFNPVTILLFAVLVPMAVAEGGRQHPAPFPVGVFLGSALWWLALSGAVSVVRRRVDARAVAAVNRACGFVMLAAALFLAAQPPPSDGGGRTRTVPLAADPLIREAWAR